MPKKYPEKQRKKFREKLWFGWQEKKKTSRNANLKFRSVRNMLFGFGTLNREEAINFLKEIMHACESFASAEAVSMVNNKDNGEWVLRAKWTPQEAEKNALKRIMRKFGVEIAEKEGYAIFHKSN